jgi:outer membrane lipoprotein SlyB
MNPIASSLNATSTPNYSIDQILQSTQPAKQPSGFRRVLGALVGGVGNMFAPGVGGLIGNAISGSPGIPGISGLSSGGLMGDTMQYLQLQQQMSQQQEAFETVSSVVKARHDASMAAIRNIS